MELFDALRLHRQEPGQFTTRPIAPDHVRLLIEAAARSPSHFNSQPWRFVVVTASAAQAPILAALESPMRGEPMDRDTRTNTTSVATSPAQRHATYPALLAITLTRGEYKPGELQGLYSTITLGAVVQTLSLVAASIAIGLRLISLTEPVNAVNAVSQVLAIPDDQMLAMLFALGYIADPARPDEAHAVPAPLPLKDLVSLDTWGAPLPDVMIGTRSILWPDQ